VHSANRSSDLILQDVILDYLDTPRYNLDLIRSRNSHLLTKKKYFYKQTGLSFELLIKKLILQ
jgi:hypothetical protein